MCIPATSAKIRNVYVGSLFSHTIVRKSLINLTVSVELIVAVDVGFSLCKSSKVGSFLCIRV